MPYHRPNQNQHIDHDTPGPCHRPQRSCHPASRRSNQFDLHLVTPSLPWLHQAYRPPDYRQQHRFFPDHRQPMAQLARHLIRRLLP
jgi:hypothetical protein